LKSARWVYLLTGLSCPTKTIYPDVRSNSWEILSESIAEIDLSRIGIRLKRVFLTEEHRVRTVKEQYAYESRFAFYINDGKRDDNLAQRFADAVMLSLAVVYEVAIEETPTAIGITEHNIKKGRIIKIWDLVGRGGFGSDMYFRVVNSIGVPSEILDYVWRIVPMVVENQSIMDAASFYRESITQVWVADDDVFEIMSDNSDIPSSHVERARVETAYQNAFKAIEAIIGEPPKDTNKLKTKLVSIGINPDEMVGYELYEMKPAKEKLIKKLVDMQEIRDKKAAHGKTIAPRTIGYCELKDKQALAQHVILASIHFGLR
jgi:hypothetical protein